MEKKPIRSPSYPGMPLADAVEEVGKIEAQYRGSIVDREVAVKLIGYSSQSGPANKALAALASYGLVERAGKGAIKVTARARSILHPQNEDERDAELLAAALAPKLFQDIKDRFPDIDVPPEAGVQAYLNREGFNPSAVRPAAKSFLETMEYVQSLRANDSHGGVEEDAAESELPGSERRFGGAVVGSMIQWESQGALQFEKPRRVRWVSDDGAWVAVEGSGTGISMSEVLVENAANPPVVPPRETPPHGSAEAEVRKGQRKAVFPVSEGDVTFVFPDGLTADGLEELEMYLNVFLNREKRKLTQA